MENTIMTEKIARRGVVTPVSFEPDVLNKLSVVDVMNKDLVILNAQNTISEVKATLLAHSTNTHDFIVVDKKGNYTGTANLADIYNDTLADKLTLANIVHPSTLTINSNTSLRQAAELMAKHSAELVAVTSAENTIIGSLSCKEIITAYGLHNSEADETAQPISLKRQRLKVLSKGRKLMNSNMSKETGK
jgi:CBS domain-containing protein